MTDDPVGLILFHVGEPGDSAAAISMDPSDSATSTNAATPWHNAAVGLPA